tara:strand:- start:1472 stop:2038 length:567 start_codon:yes stop_codon:yes gene_type:complete
MVTENKSHSDNKTEKEDKISDEREDIKEKLNEVETKLLRSLADAENQRKRFEKEIKDAFEFGGFNFAKEMLSLMDNLQRAKTSIKNDEQLNKNKDFDKFLNNFDIIEKDLATVFEKNNIHSIDCKNKKFDPNFHQAMLEIEDEKYEQGTIIQEIQKGYMFKDRLLRPSMVGVSKKVKKEDKKSEKKVK